MSNGSTTPNPHTEEFNENSILDYIKKPLGLAHDYTQFDIDIIMHINSAFLTLNQLGVGPESPLFIKDRSTLWETFMVGRLDIEAVKLYVYIKTRLVFDPPSNAFIVDAFEKQAAELEWRLSAQKKKTSV